MVFASRLAGQSFLPAWTLFKSVLWAVSTSKHTHGEEEALICWKKGNVVVHQVVWLTPQKQGNGCETRHSQQLTANNVVPCSMQFVAKLWYVASYKSQGGCPGQSNLASNLTRRSEKLPDFEVGFTKFGAIECILMRILACEQLQKSHMSRNAG